MKQAIAAFLRHRSAWQLIAIAAIVAIVGIAIPYNVKSSTLRMLKPLLVLLFGIGGSALVMAFVQRAQEVRGGRGWAGFLAGVGALACIISFATYSLGHHGEHMVAGCNAARLPDTVPARQAALAEAEAALSSPFALLPRLLDDEAERECERSRKDLERVEQGLCTAWTLVDRDCTCGDERYPYARCKEPRCLYEAGKPDRFDCPGDPISLDYSGP